MFYLPVPSKTTASSGEEISEVHFIMPSWIVLIHYFTRTVTTTIWKKWWMLLIKVWTNYGNTKRYLLFSKSNACSWKIHENWKKGKNLRHQRTVLFSNFPVGAQQVWFTWVGVKSWGSISNSDSQHPSQLKKSNASVIKNLFPKIRTVLNGTLQFAKMH